MPYIFTKGKHTALRFNKKSMFAVGTKREARLISKMNRGFKVRKV
jgi:hypothetical protein